MSWASASIAEPTQLDEAGRIVGSWRLRRCLGHLLGGGGGVAASTAAAAPKKKKAATKATAKKAKKAKGAKKSASAGKSSKAKLSKGKSKSKGKGKASKGKKKKKKKKTKKAKKTASDDDAAPVGQVVGAIPPSAPRTGGPARPWENVGQAERVAETSEWLKQQREKLGLDGNGFDVETLQKKKAARLKNPPKKTGGEDPLIAKLKAMGETRGPSSDETKKGKL
jgi:hypothetical protein